MQRWRWRPCGRGVAYLEAIPGKTIDAQEKKMQGNRTKRKQNSGEQISKTAMSRAKERAKTGSQRKSGG
eukprot:6196947-Pleurochrysis_carterae.AAC.1